MARAGAAAGALRGGRRRALARRPRARWRRRSPRSGCRCSSSRRGWARRSGSSASPRPTSSRRRWRRPSTTIRARSSRRRPPGLEVECSVLGHTTAAARQPAGRDRRPAQRLAGRLVRLRGEVHARRHGARRPGADLRRRRRERVRSARGARPSAHGGCSGLARADFFVDGEDVLLNELNTMPGFTQTSVYGKLWAASGVPYPDLCDRLVRDRARAPRAGAPLPVLRTTLRQPPPAWPTCTS